MSGDYELLYFILGVICYQILKMLYKIVNQMVIEHRRKRVIHIVEAKFPDATKVTYAAIDSSDKRAMDKIVKQLHEQGTLTQEHLDEFEMDPFPNQVQTSREKHDI